MPAACGHRRFPVQETDYGRPLINKRLRNFLLLLVSSAGFALAGCGGGASTTPAPTPAPAPAPASPPTPPPQTDDHGNTEQTATEIRLPSTTPGEIQSSYNRDPDYFRLQIRSAGTLTVYTTGSTDTRGHLTGPDRFSRRNDNGGSGDNFRIVVVVSPGVYHVRVSSSGPVTGAYVLEARFAEGVVDDHGDTRQTATEIRLPSTTPGELQSGQDYDYFRLQIRSAGTLTVYTTGSSDTHGTLFGPRFWSRSNDDSGSRLNFRIVDVVPPGVYYVRVAGYGSSSGAYALEVQFSEGVEDDHGNTRQTATVIRAPSTTPGKLEVSADVDFFRFELRSPATLTVYTTGNTDTVGSLEGPGLGIESDDDGGRFKNFRFVISEALPGTYYVGVTRRDDRYGVERFDLHVQTDEEPEGSDNIEFVISECWYSKSISRWRIGGRITPNTNLSDVNVAACVRPSAVERERCERTNPYFVGETDLGTASAGQPNYWLVVGRSPAGVIYGTDQDERCFAWMTYSGASHPTRAISRHPLKGISSTMRHRVPRK